MLTQVQQQYSNRSVDIWLLSANTNLGLTNIQGGRVCTGVVKLLQRYVACLMTPLGSDAMNLTKGTNLTSLHAASVSAGLAIDQELKRAAAWLMKNTPSSAPADERLANVTRDSITTGVDGVKVTAKVTTVAGSDYTLVIPTGIIIT